MQDILDKIERENIYISSVSKRSFAYFIDEVIVSLLIGISFYLSFDSSMNNEQIILMVNNLFYQIILLKIVYHSFFIWMYGQTPGKMVVRIKVITIEDFDKPNAPISIIRGVVRMISESLFYLGFLWAFFDPLKQTWHDKAAKTLVVDV